MSDASRSPPVLTTEQLNTVLAEIAERWPSTGARRLFHGRGHAFEGLHWLTVDWLPPALLITTYRADDASVESLATALRERLPDAAAAVRQRRSGRRSSAEVLWGDVATPLLTVESGLTVEVDLLSNQNIGLFLDMASVRAWLRDNCAGAKVLNLFAYTCAFSLHAIAGGAGSVVNVDMARPTLDWGRRNHAHNGHDDRQVHMLPHNVMKSWGKLGRYGPFDVILCDPPTNQGGSFNAERQYPTLLKKTASMLTPGGHLVAALNSPFLPRQFLIDNAVRHAPSLQHRGTFEASPDFPDVDPDRALKVELFRRARR